MNKRDLLMLFDDGDITFKEFFEQYELILAAEVMDRINNSLAAVKIAEAQKRKSLWMLLAAAVTLAFIFSPPIYTHIFGYANAEECAIRSSERLASLACYDLYPSVKDKPVAAPATVAPAAAPLQTIPDIPRTMTEADFTDVTCPLWPYQSIGSSPRVQG